LSRSRWCLLVFDTTTRSERVSSERDGIVGSWLVTVVDLAWFTSRWDRRPAGQRPRASGRGRRPIGAKAEVGRGVDGSVLVRKEKRRRSVDHFHRTGLENSGSLGTAIPTWPRGLTRDGDRGTDVAPPVSCHLPTFLGDSRPGNRDTNREDD
jgi:hypothetical protein